MSHFPGVLLKFARRHKGAMRQVVDLPKPKQRTGSTFLNLNNCGKKAMGIAKDDSTLICEEKAIEYFMKLH